MRRYGTVLLREARNSNSNARTGEVNINEADKYKKSKGFTDTHEG